MGRLYLRGAAEENGVELMLLASSVSFQVIAEAAVRQAMLQCFSQVTLVLFDSEEHAEVFSQRYAAELALPPHLNDLEFYQQRLGYSGCAEEEEETVKFSFTMPAVVLDKPTLLLGFADFLMTLRDG